MSNRIRTFGLSVFGLLIFLFVALRLFSVLSGWDELTKAYKIQECSPNILVVDRQGVFKKPDRDRGNIVIRPLNIGVSDKGLYLITPPPYHYFYPCLLIPWHEIDYQKPVKDDIKNKRHTFYLGNPTIISLRLYPDIIKKLEEDYGKPIFSIKLGELF